MNQAQYAVWWLNAYRDVSLTSRQTQTGPKLLVIQ